MPSLFAFLHHLAAFAFVSVVTVEFVLMRHELNARTARAILVADAVGGASAGAVLVIGLLRVFYFVLVERAYTLLRPLRRLNCSIYDPAFWSHERYWKLVVTNTVLMPFDGTPLKSLVWRLLGVRIGRRVFDDGCAITERTMVTIGDDCTLNMQCIIQSHSQEDGGFKSDRITIGAGCTLGVGSWIHYGAKMGDGAQLAAHSFLMKGEEVPPRTRWGENPARELRDDHTTEARVTTAAPAWLEADERPAAEGGQAA